MNNRCIHGIGNYENDSYACRHCGNYDFWRRRLRIGLKRKLPEVKDLATIEGYDPDDFYVESHYNYDSFMFSPLGKQLKKDGILDD